MTRFKFSLIAYGVYAVTAVVGLLVAPWWSLAVVSSVFGLAWRAASPGLAFWPGFSVGAVAYFVGCLLYGSGGLPDMLAELFGLGGAMGLYLVTALVGGLLAGACAMTGAYAVAAVAPLRNVSDVEPVY